MDLNKLTNNDIDSPSSPPHVLSQLSTVDEDNDDYAEINTSTLPSEGNQSEIHTDKLQSEMTEDEEDNEADDSRLRSFANEASSPFLGAAREEEDGDVTQSDLEVEDDEEVSKAVINAQPNAEHQLQQQSSVNIDLDDVSDAQNCKWRTCSAMLKNLRDLMLHIEEEHLRSKSPFQCHWDTCKITLPFHSALLQHIRAHVNYTPLFCPVVECEVSLSAEDDLYIHYTTQHSDQQDFENKATLIKWEQYLSKIETHDKIISENPLKRDFAKYASLDSDKQFFKILPSAKIDFQRLQNVTAEDLVTEQIRKKGRTATAEINAGIREPFLWEDREYKKFVASQSKYLFEAEEQAEMERRDKEKDIDSIKTIEELKSLEASLKRRDAWALEINRILNKDLKKLKDEEKRLWSLKEALLQVELELEIPENVSRYSLD